MNIKILINHTIDKTKIWTRQAIFFITEDYLNQYLKEMKDIRSVDQFLETYNEEDANYLYGFAADDGMILSQDIKYSTDFEEKYKKLNKNISKEKFYWTEYAFNI